VLFVLSLVWASFVVTLGVSIGYKHTFQMRLHTMELKVWRTVAYMSASFLFLPVLSTFLPCPGKRCPFTQVAFQVIGT